MTKPNPAIHRVLKRGARGADVKRLQAGVAKTLDDWKLDWRAPAIDGQLGPATIKAALLASYVMGMSADARSAIRQGGFNEYAQGILRHDRRRSAAMKARSLARRKHIRRLRYDHQAKPSGAELGMWDGRQVAGWMVGTRPGPDGKAVNWLLRIKQTGHWAGQINSGFRDPAYSESLCYAMCGAPSCPGRCAGRSSNHSQTGPPNWGAIDVVDPAGFAAGAAEVGAPFHNHLPIDPVHYSYTGY